MKIALLIGMVMFNGGQEAQLQDVYAYDSYKSMKSCVKMAEKLSKKPEYMGLHIQCSDVESAEVPEYIRDILSHKLPSFEKKESVVASL